MSGVNSVHFIGNAGRDPETRTVAGKQVCSFSLAINERKDGETLWVTVECWDKLAGIVSQYVSKGKQVYVSGRLKIRTWTKKDTGEEKTAVECVAHTVQFLGGKGDGGGDSGGYTKKQSKPPSAPPGDGPPGGDDDIPF